MRRLTKASISRGIADIRPDEAFAAWEHIASCDTDHAVVVRVLELAADESVRNPMLKDITPRKQVYLPTTMDYKDYPEHAIAVIAPDGFGSGAVFGGLGSLLSSVRNFSVYALDSPFMHSNPDPDDPLTIEELAAIYVGEIKRRQPEGPYLLGGYSVGGVLAFEVARQLLEDGNDIEKLFLIDTACPTFVRYFPDALVRYLDSIEQVRVGNGSELRPNRRGRLVANDHFCLARQQMRAYQVRRLPGRKIPRAVLIAAK
ncbi:hypothetical protein AnigIFM56816_002204 [Aspergillus niger]|nr:hypothetical protein AnigIFM56816_002204 [Aspergillus niger]